MIASLGPDAAATPMKKLPRRFTPLVFAFFMATIMAFLMCCTIVAFQTGFDAGYPVRVLHAYVLAMPVAFCCVMVVRPFVLKIVSRLVEL